MRWEYKTIKVKRNFWSATIDAEALQSQLNELGRDGWELVLVNQNQFSCVVAVLKRSK